jgi:SAM-dependent methyltransferase
MKEFWDTRYKEEAFAYGKTPNLFFRENIEKLIPGKILLPAEGEGRNAVYAALMGWDVTAFDFSEEAKNKSLKLAKEFNATINYEVLDVADFPIGNPIYDAVGLFYTHFPAPLRKDFHKKLSQVVKDSAYVVLEAFHKKQLNYCSGGPKNEEMLFSKEEMEEEFSDFKILYLEDKIINLSEGLYHQGQGHVVRMIATKN